MDSFPPSYSQREDTLQSCHVGSAYQSLDQRLNDISANEKSVQEREELAYSLLASLPRARLATIQRRITQLSQFDIVTSLPLELARHLFTYLSAEDLLQCARVCRRWRQIADDPIVWKTLCDSRGWEWKQPSGWFSSDYTTHQTSQSWDDGDDEGMGDSDDEASASATLPPVVDVEDDEEGMHVFPEDSGFASSLDPTSSNTESTPTSSPAPMHTSLPPLDRYTRSPLRLATLSLPLLATSTRYFTPNFKLLYRTHTQLRNRFLSGSYRLSTVQTLRFSPTHPLTNMIYCLQLYTYPETGIQVLFTGSRDKCVREWNLKTGLMQRVVHGAHDSSVLSICVHNGLIASASSDRQVVVWDLAKDKLVKMIARHEDSVLCVRFDSERLVSCSKDKTVRTYLFPNLEPQFVLGPHRAAVNAVSISKKLIVSGSGDRSIRLWDAQTGALLRKFEDHHSRGIASIDFRPPFVLSGSSDHHLRLFDITTLNGWSTSPEPEKPSAFPFLYDEGPPVVCRTCGYLSGGASGSSGGVGRGFSLDGANESRVRAGHSDLVRTVVLDDDLAMSGSYDLSIKVWDRRTGALLADMTGGHTGRIFCIGFDYTKVVSCGEDMKICVWDFSHGIDTSFVKL